jgi:membrane-bound serine protease (ClpP class)
MEDMASWPVILGLYLSGILLIVLELFLPTGGITGIIGLGAIGVGIYSAYLISPGAALFSVIGVVLALPVAVAFVVKYWHKTPAGRLMSPENPELTPDDRMPVSELTELLGATGKSVTMLRPVGTCEFNGKRIECKAEYGMIEAGTEVTAVRLIDRTVVVRASNQ